jgi:membrane dipeptidase
MRWASAASLLLLACAHRPPGPDAADLDLHRRALVVDTHSDVTQEIAYHGVDIGKRREKGHEDLPRMREGGLDAQFFSIWIDPEEVKPDRWFDESVRQIEAIAAMARANAQTIAMARTAAEVRRNSERGLMSALLGVEGGHSLLPGNDEEQLVHLRALAALGVRYMTLTWNNSNPVGGSSGDDGQMVGLTDQGRRVLDEMQRLGILIDLSHVSDPLFWDAIRYVKKPVIASHSSARQIANVPRDLTDAQLRAVAKNGGAVCINYWPGFLDDDFARAAVPLREKIEKLPREQREAAFLAERGSLPHVSYTRIADHVDHVVKVAGIDHVCLGADYDGVPFLPEGMEDVAKLPLLTVELRRRGYTPDQVEKILGLNTLRVLEANER